jgi:hypothetical protein
MRGWHEFVAAVGDLVPGGVPAAGTALLIAAILAALLWYWFPEWVYGLVRAIRGIGRAIASWRLPWRRRHRGEPAEEPKPAAAMVTDEELPDLPAAALTLSADELAAQGRYREAVRERLRAIVRDLVEREVIENRPGWTVTELARMAGRARPATEAPLGWASEIFSSIWYGQRDATAAHDAAMREHAAQVRAALVLRPEGTARKRPDGQRVPA